MYALKIFAALVFAFVAPAQASPLSMDFFKTPRKCFRLDCDIWVQALPHAPLSTIFDNTFHQAWESDLASGDLDKRASVQGALQATMSIPQGMPSVTIDGAAGAAVGFAYNLMKKASKKKGENIWIMTGFEPQAGPYKPLTNGVPNIADAVRFKARIRLYKAVAELPPEGTYYLGGVGVSGGSSAVSWLQNCARVDSAECA